MVRVLVYLSLLFALKGNAQIVNPDFETWQQDSLGYIKLLGWEHLVKNDLSNAALFATWQDANSQHDTFALTLSRWYNYTWDLVRQKAAINYRPDALTGYYKYTKNKLFGKLDTGMISVYITSWNAVAGMQDTLGSGFFDLTTSNNYNLFNCPITYALPGTPDSILIHITPSKFALNSSGCSDSNYCSFLTIDNLSLLSGSTVGALSQNSQFTIYPNPVKDMLVIRQEEFNSFVRLRIQNITGRTIIEKELYILSEVNIYTSGWQPGIYIMQLSAPGRLTSTIKLVKE